MQGTVPIAFGSPSPAPEVNVEPQGQQVVEPPVESTATTPPAEPGQVEQTEAAPVESNVQQPEQNEYQRRWQDTQRALAAREMEANALKAQVELLKSMAAPQTRPAPEPPKPVDIEALRNEVNLTPSKMIDEIIARDRYYDEKLARQAMYFEEQLAKLNPDYATVQPALKAIEDMPEMQFLSPSQKVEMVKRIQAATSNGQRPAMPSVGTPPGQRRVVPPPAQPMSNEQRFAAHLRASGAVKEKTVPGTMPWTITREK